MHNVLKSCYVSIKGCPRGVDKGCHFVMSFSLKLCINETHEGLAACIGWLCRLTLADMDGSSQKCWHGYNYFQIMTCYEIGSSAICDAARDPMDYIFDPNMAKTWRGPCYLAVMYGGNFFDVWWKDDTLDSDSRENPLHIHYSDGILNHRQYGSSFYSSFSLTAKEISKLRITGHFKVNHRWPVTFHHNGVIMFLGHYWHLLCYAPKHSYNKPVNISLD